MNFLKSGWKILLLILPTQVEAEAPGKTMIDLYCETMSVAYAEDSSTQNKLSESQYKKLAAAEQEILNDCKTVPATDGKVVLLKDASPQLKSQIFCIATAEGISLSRSINEHQAYSEVKRIREFYGSACISNQKLFLSDIKRFGPAYVLNKKY